MPKIVWLKSILSHSVKTFMRWITILSHSAENFEKWITILCHSIENFVGHPPCIPNFLNFANFSDQSYFVRIFWLLVFYFVGTNILKHEETLEYLEVLRGVLKLLIQDACNYLTSMAISILGILDFGFFGLGYFGFGYFVLPPNYINLYSMLS